MLPQLPATDQPTPSKKLVTSPARKKLSSTEPHATRESQKDRNYKREMAFELEGQWVGPMPPKDFLRDFLPVTEEKLATQPTADETIFESLIKDYKKETEVYDHFINHVAATGVLPGFTIVNTSQHPDKANERTMLEKPDLAIYKQEVAQSFSNTGSTHFSLMDCVIEWKTPKNDKGCHPFSDAPTKQGQNESYAFELQRDASMECRGQVGLYARTLLARQHRTHCYVVYIGDPMVRFIRFDREGAIVSASFNFRTQGSLLQEFFWRFANATDSVRGLDPTVTVATEDEAATAKHHLQEWAPTGERQVLKIEVTNEMMVDDDDSEEAKTMRRMEKHHVFVWEAFVTPHSVTGRGTRGYPAWGPVLKRVVFLKDTWRSKAPRVEKETDILKYLNTKEVRNIPKVLRGGDVQGDLQTTLTSRYSNQPWNRGAKLEGLNERQHNRFLMDKIGMSLYNFPSSKVFLTAIRDAFYAHKDAYEKAGMLHRDISIGNILIIKNADGSYGGLLIDWDLARHVNDLRNGPRQSSRSGTWQFMSIDVLRNIGKLHTVQDDLESFFWVVLYGIVRYMETTKKYHLEDAMHTVFDYYNTIGNTVKGGHTKADFLQTCDPFGENFHVVANPSLTWFIRSFRSMVLDYSTYLSSISSRAVKLGLMDATLTPEAARERAIKESNTDNLQLKNHDSIEELFKVIDTGTWPATDPSTDRLEQKSALVSIPHTKADKRKSPDEHSEQDDLIKKMKPFQGVFGFKPATQ